MVWIDLILPAGDPLWQADVGRATWWVGAAWASALEASAGVSADVWRGAMQRNPWSARVCFAGLGPGEVRIAGQKVVGVSQRRTRAGALFQTALLLEWNPGGLLALLRLEDSERIQGGRDLERVAVGVGAQYGRPLVGAFLTALP